MPQRISERLCSWAGHPGLHLLALAGRSHRIADMIYRFRARTSTGAGAKFLLILDCDTELDIRVVKQVDQQLRDRGVEAVYAVPGEILRSGDKEFSVIASRGAQFLNHGDRCHTEVDERRTRYISTFFYHNISIESMFDDVEAGHRSVVDVIGQSPKAFRAPHFSTLSFSPNLQRLQAHLGDMGYNYSLSTSPLEALRYGPILQSNGIAEIPTTGRPSNRGKVLDSWTARFDPEGPRENYNFLGECSLLADELQRQETSISTIYADPSQVHDWPSFFDALAMLAPYSVSSVENLATHPEEYV